MPIDICGWIEVKNPNTAIWDGVEDILSYAIFAGSESDYLFGITKRPRVEAVAANRGLPADIGSETKYDLESWKDFEKEESNFSFDELFGFSFLTYDEIIRKGLEDEIGSENGWCKVFDKMKSVLADGIKPENIRVVVWAHW
jgi:hypothetical protein